MIKLVLEKEIVLDWRRFDSMKEAIHSDSGRQLTPVIYAITDKNRKILYLGKTVNSRGLYERYQGQDGAIDAAMDGNKKYVFIAKAEIEDVTDLEKQLIFQEKPKYNMTGKLNQPGTGFILRHIGDYPSFTV